MHQSFQVKTEQLIESDTPLYNQFVTLFRNLSKEKSLALTLKLLISHDNLRIQLHQLEKEVHQIRERIILLEQQSKINLKSEEISIFSTTNKSKKKRRLANDIVRTFQVIYIIFQKFKKCPYKNCDKKYGTDISLNLHIRIKHNGGSKIEREIIAQDILIAQIKGEQPPQHNFNLPPDFIEEFRRNYQPFTEKITKQYL